MMNKPIFFFLMFVFCNVPLAGQGVNIAAPADWPISIQLMTQSSTTTPNFKFLEYPIHPTITLGTEKILASNLRHDWHLAGEVGYFYQPSFQQSFFLNGMGGYRYYTGFGLQLQARLGLGYGQIFHTDRVYKFQDGRFQEVSNWGVPVGNAIVDLGLGYALGKAGSGGVVSLHFRYNVELPLNILGVHQFWGIGYRFYPFQ